MLALVHLPATAANIVVEGPCTLADAIDAANNDNDAGGLCPPGGSGADVLELTGDVTLTALDNNTLGANGLPVIDSDITIAGGGHAVSRDSEAEDFRIFFVDSGARLVLESLTVSNGAATPGAFYGAAGGAIYSEFGTVELFDSTLSYNNAEWGGAIFGGFASVYLLNSTLSGNYASESGGAVGTYDTFLVATNSTLSGNTAGYIGGAIWGGYSSGVSLVNSTVAANAASAGGAISDYGSFSIPVDVYGSVFGYNGGGNCAVYFLSDGGGNLDDDGSCSAGFGPLSGLDPTLADNGGATGTHTLLGGSSAIDAAGECGLGVDQRGFARDALCDSGAVEFGAAPVGGAARGVQVRRVTCRNVSTAQVVTILDPQGAWDCEAAGLVVAPGDRIRQQVLGLPTRPDVGATAIGVSQVETLCLNEASGQEEQFVPLGSLSWSCSDQGLTVERGNRILQTFIGLAD
jgi:hypothetical protein